MKLTLLLTLAPLAALAHETGPIQPHDLRTAWEFTPGVVIPLALTALLYARGARRERGETVSRMACFWTGFGALALALVSPLHRMGEALFSAHMAQHEILMLIAAPLLAASRPLTAMLWALPLEWRRAAGRWAKAGPVHRLWEGLSEPVNAWCIHAVALWAWHAPALFLATITNEWVHAAQHLSFFLSALLFWWSLFYARGRMAYGPSVFYVFTTAAHTGILGALLTFAPAVIYPAYAESAPLWGLTAIQDQQLGGLIMWVPASLMYMGVGLALFAAWLRASEAAAAEGPYAD